MKLIKKLQPLAAVLVTSAAAMVSMESASAATSIATSRIMGGYPIQSEYQLNVPVVTAVQASSWYNPGFGNAGWTHFSKWGRIKLQAGKTYSITIESSNPAMHPGLSVWYRATGKRYANPDFFTGHSYIQYDSFDAKNQINEETGENLGMIKMELAANGFDSDGMTGVPCATAGCWWPTNPSFNSLSDGVPGKVVLSFKPRRTGTYQFVMGGINPNDKTTTTGALNNNSTFVPVTVTVSRTR